MRLTSPSAETSETLVRSPASAKWSAHHEFFDGSGYPKPSPRKDSSRPRIITSPIPTTPYQRPQLQKGRTAIKPSLNSSRCAGTHSIPPHSQPSPRHAPTPQPPSSEIAPSSPAPPNQSSILCSFIHLLFGHSQFLAVPLFSLKLLGRLPSVQFTSGWFCGRPFLRSRSILKLPLSPLAPRWLVIPSPSDEVRFGLGGVDRRWRGPST